MLTVDRIVFALRWLTAPSYPHTPRQRWSMSGLKRLWSAVDGALPPLQSQHLIRFVLFSIWSIREKVWFQLDFRVCLSCFFFWWRSTCCVSGLCYSLRLFPLCDLTTPLPVCLYHLSAVHPNNREYTCKNVIRQVINTRQQILGHGLPAATW